MKYRLALLALIGTTECLAYVVNIGTGTRAVYFRVEIGRASCRERVSSPV